MYNTSAIKDLKTATSMDPYFEVIITPIRLVTTPMDITELIKNTWYMLTTRWVSIGSTVDGGNTDISLQTTTATDPSKTALYYSPSNQMVTIQLPSGVYISYNGLFSGILSFLQPTIREVKDVAENVINVLSSPEEVLAAVFSEGIVETIKVGTDLVTEITSTVDKLKSNGDVLTKPIGGQLRSFNMQLLTN